MFSAHGLRSGYLTEAANRGIPLPEAMQQSLHKSVTQAASYYNNAERKERPGGAPSNLTSGAFTSQAELVKVLVPAPERYATHKLIVDSIRLADALRHAKVDKVDFRQPCSL